ncbi:MAG: glycerol-3-phosphate acyltransferase PlsX [Halioglobus sp.]
MPKKAVNLAVDTMSGDFGLRVTIPAALQSLKENPHLIVHLVGDQHRILEALSLWSETERSRVRILHATDVIKMDVKTAAILSASRATSMHVALDALRQGKVEAVVSAGNSVALMILSRKLLGTVEAAMRPAFCSMFPTAKDAALLLDLGANVDCSPEQLVSFAVLGSVLSSTIKPNQTPRVALLSNGTEPKKGNVQIRAAARLFEDHPHINYVGYVEANNLHETDVDVVVCDGLVGNIALKAVEGTARASSEHLKATLEKATELGLSDTQRQSLLKAFGLAMNPDSHNGAFLLGLSSLVVKAHGASSVEGFAASIGQALQCEENNMIARMKQRLTAIAHQ